MRVLGIVLVAVTTLGVVCAAALSAQPPSTRPRPLIYPCSDSTSDLYRKRILIDLTYDGANRREMWQAIEMAAGNASACLAKRGDASPPADTSVYGQLRINRVGDGGYEIATELAGPRANARSCSSPRAAIITGNAPIIWGTMLGNVVRRFVECLIAERARVSAPNDRRDTLSSWSKQPN